MSTALDLTGLTPDQVDLVEQFAHVLRQQGERDRPRQDLLRRWDERAEQLPPMDEDEVDELVDEAVREVRGGR